LRVAWNRVDRLKNMRPTDGTIDSKKFPYSVYDVVDLAEAKNNPPPDGVHWEHKISQPGKVILMLGTQCPKLKNIFGPHPYPID